MLQFYDSNYSPLSRAISAYL